MADFDPYRKWLGIPALNRTPTHYELLGVSPDERDLEVINAACVRQSAYVRNFQTGKYAEEATRILNELAAANACLGDVLGRAAYDLDLKRKQPKPAVKPPEPRPSESGTVARPRNAPAVTRPKPAEAPQPASPSVAALTSYPAHPSLPASPLWGQPTGGIYGGQRLPQFLLPPQPRFRLEAWHLMAIGGLAIAISVLVAVFFVLGGRNRQTPAVATVASEPPTAPSPASTTSNNSASATSGTSPIPTPAVIPRPEPSPATVKPESGQTTAPQTTPSNDPELETNTMAPSTSRRMVSGAKAEWGGQFSIPHGALLPPVLKQGARRLALDGELWDLQTGKSQGRCWPDGLTPQVAALSQDGKWFAAATSVETDEIQVHNASNGELTQTLKFEFGKFQLVLLEFADETNLVAAWRGFNENRVQLWDVTDGQLVAAFDTDLFEGRDAALSPDGEHFAVAVAKMVRIYETRTRKKVATAVAPGGGSLSDCDGLCFSPNGQEMALVMSSGRRILAWDASADVVFDYAAKSDLVGFGRSYQGPAITYLPDGSGWLLYGHVVFDRASQEVVAQIRSEQQERARHLFLDQDHLLVTRGKQGASTLEDLVLPWDKIRKAQQSARKRKFSRGGVEVKLAVKVTGGTSTPAAELTDGLTKLLGSYVARGGYRVGETAVCELHAEYAESKENREVMVRDTSRGLLAPLQKRNVTVTIGTLNLALVPPDGGAPVWSDIVSGDDEPVYYLAQSESALWDSLTQAIHRHAFPVILTEGDELLTFPLVLDITR